MSYMKTLQIDKDVIQDFEQIKIEANKLLNIPPEKSVGYNNLLILQKIKENQEHLFNVGYTEVTHWYQQYCIVRSTDMILNFMG